MLKIKLTPESETLRGTFKLSTGDLILALSVTSMLMVLTAVLLTGLLDDRTAQDLIAVAS